MSCSSGWDVWNGSGGGGGSRGRQATNLFLRVKRDVAGMGLINLQGSSGGNGGAGGSSIYYYYTESVSNSVHYYSSGGGGGGGGAGGAGGSLFVSWLGDAGVLPNTLTVETDGGAGGVGAAAGSTDAGGTPAQPGSSGSSGLAGTYLYDTWNLDDPCGGCATGTGGYCAEVGTLSDGGISYGCACRPGYHGYGTTGCTLNRDGG